MNYELFLEMSKDKELMKRLEEVAGPMGTVRNNMMACIKLTDYGIEEYGNALFSDNVKVCTFIETIIGLIRFNYNPFDLGWLKDVIEDFVLLRKMVFCTIESIKVFNGLIDGRRHDLNGMWLDVHVLIKEEQNEHIDEYVRGLGCRGEQLYRVANAKLLSKRLNKLRVLCALEIILYKHMQISNGASVKMQSAMEALNDLYNCEDWTFDKSFRWEEKV